MKNTSNTQKPATSGPLKYYPHRKIAIHRLPFVGSHSWPRNSRFWAIPATGGYGGGCATGEALALLYLKHLRHSTVNDAPTLGWINHAMWQRLQEESRGIEGGSCITDYPSTWLSLRGQSVGFLRVMNICLEIACRELGHCLDNMSEQELLNRANQGLGSEEQ